ncbi:MAG: hypothetical protein AB7V55_03335, partial [Oscillospiraceae bacterium]
MISKKRIRYINELQDIQRLAVACRDGVGLQSPDGSMVVDAKSYIGMYALNFNEPVYVVSENEEFHRQIRDIG